MAIGTTGAPVSSAIRPMPRLGLSDSSPVRERPPSQYMTMLPPRPRTVFAVMTPADREDPPVVVDELRRWLEELRLGHEAHAPPREHRDEEVVHEREMVRREDHRAGVRDVLGGDAAGAKHCEAERRQDEPDHVVHPVRLPRARALVEAIEVLCRARVLVDLRLHGRPLLTHPALAYPVSRRCVRPPGST